MKKAMLVIIIFGLGYFLLKTCRRSMTSESQSLEKANDSLPVSALSTPTAPTTTTLYQAPEQSVEVTSTTSENSKMTVTTQAPHRLKMQIDSQYTVWEGFDSADERQLSRKLLNANRSSLESCGLFLGPNEMASQLDIRVVFSHERDAEPITIDYVKPMTSNKELKECFEKVFKIIDFQLNENHSEALNLNFTVLR